jgi:hypothetical protein
MFTASDRTVVVQRREDGGNAKPVTSGHFDEWAKLALLNEAQDRVRPMRIVARRVADGFAADLVAVDGSMAVANYGCGPDELLAALVAEQRYLVEQEGSGSVGGATYLDKARERVRRGSRMTCETDDDALTEVSRGETRR